DLYSQKRDKDECTRYSYKRLNEAKLFYTARDTSLIRIYTETGSLLGRAGDKEEAAAILKEGLQSVDLEKSQGSHYHSYRKILLEYSLIQFNVGEYLKADSLLDLILDLDHRFNAENSLEYAEDINYKAIAAWYLGDAAEAIRYFNLSRETFERIKDGTKSPAYLELLSDLCNQYAHQNRLTDSKDILLLRYQTLQSLPGTNPFELASGQL